MRFVTLMAFFTLNIGAISHAELPFFRHHPFLKKTIHHISLGDFPTPLDHCTHLSQKLECHLYCKRDDLSGCIQNDGTRLFGGNKVRKLEFVLADALDKKANDILTVGCIGSNHALATTVYAHKLNMKTRCLLAYQPHSWVVRRNLLLQNYYGADLYFFQTVDERNKALESHKDDLKKKRGKEPYVIPVGASIPLGVLGFINAVYELQEQVTSGSMPSFPDIIYIPSGSHGTAVGLLIGLQMLGASTRVAIIAVETGDIVGSLKILFEETRQFLMHYDQIFAKLSWKPQQMLLHQNFTGKEYGDSTNASEQAISLFRESEGLMLENTYSAKAAAALIHDAQKGFLKNKHVLFWLTFYSEPCEKLCTSTAREECPKLYIQQSVKPVKRYSC